MLERTLTLGCLNDWSMMPLRKELRKLSIRLDVLTADQSGLCEMLESNKLAAGACGLTQLMKTPQFDLALPMGVVARSGAGIALWGGTSGYGNYSSEMLAYLTFRVQKLKEIFSHTLSAQPRDFNAAARFIWSACGTDTANQPPFLPTIQVYPGASVYHALSRVLLKLLGGDHASEAPHGLYAGASSFKWDLLAGNDALVRRPQYPFVVDLIELWEKMTGLPFVLHVWLRHQEALDPGLRVHIIKIAEFAAASMKVQPMGYYPENMPLTSAGTSVDLAALWRRIHYKLGAAEMKSILLFLNLLRHLDQERKEDDLFVVKMIRLQQRENELSQQA